MSNFKKILETVRSSLDDYNQNTDSDRKTFCSVSPVIESLTEWYNNASELNIYVYSNQLLFEVEVELTKLFSILAKCAVKPTKALSDWMIILLLPKVFTSQVIKYYLQKSALRRYQRKV